MSGGKNLVVVRICGFYVYMCWKTWWKSDGKHLVVLIIQLHIAATRGETFRKEYYYDVFLYQSIRQVLLCHKVFFVLGCSFLL